MTRSVIRRLALWDLRRQVTRIDPERDLLPGHAFSIKDGGSYLVLEITRGYESLHIPFSGSLPGESLDAEAEWLVRDFAKTNADPL